MTRVARFRGVFLFAIFFSLCAPLFSAVPYPHDSSIPDYCSNCHTEDIYSGDCDEISGYCLISGSVDEVCLLCHVKEECCRVGLESQEGLFIGERNHPSDIAVSEVDPGFLPNTLPLHNGRITCRTCHLHTREGADSYKMLRLVDATDNPVNLSTLCADCHNDY